MTTAPTKPRAESAQAVQSSTGTDQIRAWLDRLLRLARLPARESAELRDELDAHLRERVRDLMLAGHDEPVAIHKSISELGDLALLAQRYREASRTPTRRLIMHAAIIATATAALGLSTVALQQSQPDPDSGLTLEVQPEIVAQGETGAPYLSTIPILSYAFNSAPTPTLEVTEDIDNSPLSDVLEMLAATQGVRPYIHWRDLEAIPEAELTDLPLAGQPLDRALDMINDALDLDGQISIEVRIDNGLFEVASCEYFDRRERELVTYDVGELVYADSPLMITEESEVLVDLIIEIVEPEAWPEQGGNSASISAAGSKLFVNAPPRVHEQIAWLLAQLQDDESAAAPADQAGRSVKLFALERADAKTLEGPVGDAIGQFQGQAKADPRNNALLVVGDDRVQAMARSLVGALDRAPDPGPSTRSASPPGDLLGEYVVQPGDSWHSIAESLLGDGDRWHELAAENPRTGPAELRVGERLRLPPVANRGN